MESRSPRPGGRCLLPQGTRSREARILFPRRRSNKFWTIEQVGTAYVTTNGRVGATPRETRKQCNTENDARREVEKQIAAKLKKGYVEGIVPQYEKPDWASMSMSEDVFWRLIGLFNWKKTRR